MKEQKAGTLSRIVKENQPVAGCTISQQIYQSQSTIVSVFSLAKETSISAESYQYHKLITVYSGQLEIFTESTNHQLSVGDTFITPVNRLVGVRALNDCIYVEISLPASAKLNNTINPKKSFKLNELLPYEENKIINLDLVDDPSMKFVLMSFGNKTELAEHAAPGKAMIFVINGLGNIIYEGQKQQLKAGESFMMAKNAHHAVQASDHYKMALLVMKH